jgi:hypothetical protein
MAIWIWPLAISVSFGSIYVLRNIFYHEYCIIYIPFAAILIPLFFIAIRRGFKLVPIETIQSHPGIVSKWVIPMGNAIICSLLIGYYTQDWINILIGFCIGLIVWGFFYYFSEK